MPPVFERPPEDEKDQTTQGLPRAHTMRRWGPASIIVGLALVLSGIGAIVVSTSYDTPREAKALGKNLPVNEGASNAADISANNSPTLVRNPRDGANLVTANRIDSPRFSCALHVSFDGGGRWSTTPIPAPPVKRPTCFAPDVAFSSDGTLHLSFVTLEGRANTPSGVWMSRSKDGGETLSPPEKLPIGPRAFQVRMTADPQAPRRLYLTWLQASDLGLYKFTETGNPIQAIRSDDGGQSWSDPVNVSDSARERVVAPSSAVGPDGELYVLYLDLGEDVLDYQGAHRGRGGPPYDGRWELVLARSSDRGATWEESPVDDGLIPTERFIVFTPPFPSLTVDRNSGRLYAAFQDGRLGDADVWLWSLGPGSETWEGPRRVNDNRERDKTSQYLPKLSVAPDGRLDVAYYDRRADPADVQNEVSLQSSFDEGKSFIPRIRLSDRAFSSRIGEGAGRGLPDLGSRMGLVSTDSRAFAVWSDTRAGTPRSLKQDLARAVVAFNDPPRLSGVAEALLRYGGIVTVLLGVAVLVAFGLTRQRAAA